MIRHYWRVLCVGVAVLSSPAFTAPTEQVDRNPDDVRETARRAYRYVIEGNQEDLKRHNRLAQKFEKSAAALKGKKADEYAELAKLFRELSATNQAILDAFDAGAGLGLERQMTKIVELENRILEHTGKDLSESRKWLTFEEVQANYRSGYVFKTKGNALPHHRSNWDFSKYRKGYKRESRRRGEQRSTKTSQRSSRSSTNRSKTSN